MGSSPSAYGTFGQGGNIAEWNESAYDGLNDSPSENRVVRGGYWAWEQSHMRSSGRQSYHDSVNLDSEIIGFRVASVIPEPTTFTLLGLGSLALVMVRRKR